MNSKNEAKSIVQPIQTSCDDYDFSSNTVETLNIQHENIHRTSCETAKTFTDTNWYKCDACDYKSKSEKGLNIHKGAKHKDLKCLHQQGAHIRTNE